jgi:hypothetical protein
MEIQTLSLVVPGGCPNRCRFCVSALHGGEEYRNQIEKNRRFKDLYRRDYLHRLAFARDNGCNTMILTGDGEPICNPDFLEDVATWNQMLSSPFRWVELQTSGVTLDDELLRWLRNTVGVSLISLSLADAFDSAENARVERSPEKLAIDIDALCSEIRRYDFALRLSLNLTKRYDPVDPALVFERAKTLGAHQVTFRVLYNCDGAETPEQREVQEWIDSNRASPAFVASVAAYIKEHGRQLERLPFGAMRYSVHGISTVLDDDCMSVAAKDTLKYLILRPNAKLYTKWDDPGSMLF